MIILITPAEDNGGILQFSVKITSELSKVEDCILFVPDTVNDTFLLDVRDSVIKYNKVKSLLSSNSRIQNICIEIMDKRPRKVIFLEDSLLMQQMNNILIKNNVATNVIIHDVIHHPARYLTIRENVVEIIRQLWIRRTLKNRDNDIILLSENSRAIFEKEHPKHKAKLKVFKLGAHVPNVEPLMPIEIQSLSFDYMLFFGRIDKYKGIENMCVAYNKLPMELHKKCKIIIAGKGKLSEKEMSLIRDSSDYIIINRFIHDDEMIWLMKNAKCIIVPYIEASQSGVVPIAFHFGKPVISSNLKGLVENVKNGVTGYVFDDIESLVHSMELIIEDTSGYKQLENNIRTYYDNELNWSKNLKCLI